MGTAGLKPGETVYKAADIQMCQLLGRRSTADNSSAYGAMGLGLKTQWRQGFIYKYKLYQIVSFVLSIK